MKNGSTRPLAVPPSVALRRMTLNRPASYPPIPARRNRLPVRPRIKGGYANTLSGIRGWISFGGRLKTPKSGKGTERGLRSSITAGEASAVTAVPPGDPIDCSRSTSPRGQVLTECLEPSDPMPIRKVLNGGRTKVTTCRKVAMAGLAVNTRCSNERPQTQIRIRRCLPVGSCRVWPVHPVALAQVFHQVGRCIWRGGDPKASGDFIERDLGEGA